MKIWVIPTILLCVLVSNDVGVLGKGGKSKGKGKGKGKSKGKGKGKGKGENHGHALHSHVAHKMCNCEKIDTIEEAYDNNPIVFWGKVSSKESKRGNILHEVQVLEPKMKGCFSQEIIHVISDKHCPVQLSIGKTYLITAQEDKSDIIISSCSSIIEKKTDMSHYASSLLWLNSQMGECGDETFCVDGSNPFVCSGCPMKEEMRKICPIAESCKMNKCNSCQPQFFDKDGIRVCDDCPPGQPPLPCPEGSSRCLQAALPSCFHEESALIYCVPNSCGSCTTLWVDDIGKQICKNESVFNQCLDLTAVFFGNCYLSEIIERFGMINGKCSVIEVCASMLDEYESSLFLFNSMDDCKQVCEAVSTAIDLPSIRNTPPCKFPDDPHCCPDSRFEEQCIMKNLQMYCKFVECDGIEVAHCSANPCESCKVKMKDVNNQTINPDLCALNLLDYQQCTAYSNVTCHESHEEPDCGPLPSACPSDWNARCVIDACSCKPIWMNEDIRNPEEDCLRALVAECVLEEECPIEFECLPPREALKSQMDFPLGFELQCIQEPCTCVPMWHMYDIMTGPLVIPGFVEKCTKEDKNCCQIDDRTFKPKNCTQVVEINQQICEQMECGNEVIDRASCSADVCDDCNLQVMSISHEPIPIGTCTYQTPPDKCNIAPNKTCPLNIPLDCGPFPVACPKDWNIKCVLDPCVCKPFWFDGDVRFTKETCKMALEPPCIPYDECPILPCPPLTEEQTQSLTGNVLQDLQCLPKPCTCRPVYVNPSHPHHRSHHHHKRGH